MLRPSGRTILVAAIIQKQWRGGLSRGLMASLAFHFFLLAVLALLAHNPPQLVEANEQPIAVRLVPQPTPSPVQTVERPSPHIEAQEKAADVPPSQEATRIQPGVGTVETGDPPPPIPADDLPMIAATKFYSTGILNDPRSRGAKAALRALENSEKMVQTCNLEAMAQVGHWEKTHRPDFVVAYTFEEPKFSGPSLEAMGAAFRSRHQWYRLRYICRLTARLDAVAGFTFAVGDAIPAEQWAQYNLTDDGGTD